MLFVKSSSSTMQVPISRWLELSKKNIHQTWFWYNIITWYRRNFELHYITSGIHKKNTTFIQLVHFWLLPQQPRGSPRVPIRDLGPWCHWRTHRAPVTPPAMVQGNPDNFWGRRYKPGTGRWQLDGYKTWSNNCQNLFLKKWLFTCLKMEVHCYICHSPLVVMVCAICVSSMCVSSLFISESHQMLKHPTELWFDHLAAPHSPKSSKTGNAVMPPRSWCHHVKAKLTFEVEKPEYQKKRLLRYYCVIY